MVKTINIIATLAVLIILNTATMLVFDKVFSEVLFIDVAALVGLLGIVVVRFFIVPSNLAKAKMLSDSTSSFETVNLQPEKKIIYPSLIYFTCLGYTAAFLLITIIAYQEYFLT
ncbi:hypothetical protein [Jeotgalibacillus soli]|uniref:Uncharacterized protein n=1 Tax=Jeotgalibacillus soli TaxID=889306 RepID=A0A0C2V8P6_9BACL|nr:hypothetical protein [Jeotgalibacillus soli]KIL45332.1 hypothetical protein KP78_28760 [Jeotgalibacillus soli]